MAEQMADLKKRKAELAAETPEQTAAREKLRAELAATVIGNAKESAEEYIQSQGTDKKLTGT